MSHCAIIENDYLKITTDPIESCSGFVILDKTEFLSYQAYQGFFSMPSNEELEAAFNISFVSVVSVYLFCYGIMKIIQMIRG